MNFFQRFQNRIKADKIVEQKLNTHFIFNGNSSIKITNGDREIQAAVVNKEDKEIAYLYTQLDDDLPIGSVWQAKGLRILIAKEFTIIKTVNWRKYYGILCNFRLGDTWGSFIGPGKKFISLKLEKEVILESNQKAILILPKKILDFKDIIVIDKKAWLVQEIDNLSTPGISYYSIVPTSIDEKEFLERPGENNFIIKNKNIKEEEEKIEEINPHLFKVANNSTITLTTEDGFFKYDNNNIKITSRTMDSVSFFLPFGVEEVKIKIKKGNEIIQKTYQVK